MMLDNGILYNEMFNNYKIIKPGKYYGQIANVFIDENRNREKRINFIIQYFDNEDELIKYVLTIYNMAGMSRTYLLTQLIPVMGFYGIGIGFDLSIDEIFKRCKKLIGKALPFLVEQTATNKNIRLLPPTYCM